MNILLVLVCCIQMVSVLARPDVSLGYQYKPDYNSGSNLLAPPIASTSYYPTASGTDGPINPENFDSGAAVTSSGSSSFLGAGYNVAGVSSTGATNFNGLSSSSVSSGFANAASYEGAGYNSGISQGYIGVAQQQYPTQYQQQPPIITKHFYLHTAPEDHDNQEIVRYVTIGRPTKNYNVVFINTPSSTSTKAKIIANVAPVEDRTAIYVLAKKANDLNISTDVVTPAPTGPNKPEVFFVKYKTPEEAIHAQHVIQAQYDKLGGSSNFSNEGNIPVQSVIGSVGGQANVATSSSAQSSSQGQNQVQQVVTTQPQVTYLPPTVYRRRRYYRY